VGGGEGEAQARRAYVLLLFSFLNNILVISFKTNYLSICWTDLHEICRIGRNLAVDERPEVSCSISQGTLPWQPILWAKSTSNPHLVVRVTFATAAPPAYDKKSRRTNYMIKRTQANLLSNKLSNKLAIIDSRLKG